MRVTQKDLEDVINRINEATNSPMETYAKEGEKLKAQIGNYHLDYAYGGVQLQRIFTEGGGVTQPLGGGYHTKREMYQMLNAFLQGAYEGSNE